MRREVGRLWGIDTCGGRGTGARSMADARRVLGSVFGFEAFRPGQAAVIEALLGGRNVLTVMPTGSGKSLCFQVPALMMDGLTVVVSPLVALMQDQVSALRLPGVAADGIHSGNAWEDNAAAWHRGWRTGASARRACTTCHRSRSSQAPVFGWAASKTLDIAQELYDGAGKKILTYPRAEVRYLPESAVADAPTIVAGLRACGPGDPTLRSRCRRRR